MRLYNKKPAPYDLTNVAIREMTECGKVLRSFGKDGSSMAEVADHIVRLFYNGFVDRKGKRVCRLVRFYKNLYPDTVRIVLSGLSDLDSVKEAINRGAIYKFLNKPWNDDEFRDIIKKAFIKHEPIKRTPDAVER